MVGIAGFTLEEIIGNGLKLGEIAKTASFEQLEKLLYTIDGMSALRVKNTIIKKIEMQKRNNAWAVLYTT